MSPGSDRSSDSGNSQGGNRRRRRRRRRGGGGEGGRNDRGSDRNDRGSDRNDRGSDRGGGRNDRGGGDRNRGRNTNNQGGGRSKRRRGRNDRGGRGGGGGESRGPDPSLEPVEGLLFVTKEGFGFLRQAKNNYLSGNGDVFVPQGVIQRYRIRPGQFIEGQLGRGKRGRKKRPLDTVLKVDGDSPERAARYPHFKQLISTDPVRRINLQSPDNDPTLRVIDLVTPMGFGQRALVVAPPRTGKTVVLQKVANAVALNHPEAHTVVLLVDERPEEVTDFRRTCTTAEVVASSLDMDASAHVAVVEVVLDRMRRLAEAGKDVIVLTDSLTRMARAFNTERGRSGRTLTGGLDSTAMQKPREFFGAARNFEDGGSITHIATALVDTGSRMDQVIFEEFKGTGNLELILSRDLADLRIFPAINVKDSGTRREEKLRDPEEFRLINLMRRALVRYNPQRAMEALLERVKTTRSNAELLLMLQKQVV